jgi:hypothetical protein
MSWVLRSAQLFIFQTGCPKNRAVRHSDVNLDLNVLILVKLRTGVLSMRTFP